MTDVEFAIHATTLARKLQANRNIKCIEHKVGDLILVAVSALRSLIALRLANKKSIP